MKFLTPAFVRVENPQERKELREWLKSIGRECVPHSKTDRAPWFTAYSTGRYEQNNGFCTHPNMARYNGYIDCDTNHSLFKALAAMNDENDREQILTDGSRYIVCHLDNFHEYPRVNICTGDDGEHNIFEIVKTENWRKATAEEIISHFKNKKS